MAGMKKFKICSLLQKDQLSKEITLLLKLSFHEKDKKQFIPAYLQYRDEGYMYFPCPELLPFLKAVYSQVNKIVNHKKFTECGSNLLSNIVEKVEGDDALPSSFMVAVRIKLPELQETESIDSVMSSHHILY